MQVRRFSTKKTLRDCGGVIFDNTQGRDKALLLINFKFIFDQSNYAPWWLLMEFENNFIKPFFNLHFSYEHLLEQPVYYYFFLS